MRKLRTRSLGDLAREHIFRNGASQFLTPEGLVAQAPSVHTPHQLSVLFLEAWPNC